MTLLVKRRSWRLYRRDAQMIQFDSIEPESIWLERSARYSRARQIDLGSLKFPQLIDNALMGELRSYQRLRHL